jgi:hypothetical protein
MERVTRPVVVDNRRRNLRPEVARRIRLRAPRGNPDPPAKTTHSCHIRQSACVVAAMRQDEACTDGIE